MQRTPVAVGLVALALFASGCQSNDTVQARQQPGTTAPTVAATLEPTAVPTTVAPRPRPIPTPSPTLSPKPKRPPYDVKAVETQLTALHYYIGGIDGDRGLGFYSAVRAFQKVQEIGADGVVGPITLGALKTPKIPSLRGVGSGTRVEIDLTRQVLYLVKDGKIARIIPVSSGSGKHYLTKKGNTATALTPVGHFQVQRRIVGEHKSDLGILYDPQFFYSGWAIHGSNSVPSYPASHGCIRVPRPDGKYLLVQIANGTPVYVYGGVYTFTPGSNAPGTNNPGGDTPSA